MRDVTPEAERFWLKVDASGDCWEWMGWQGGAEWRERKGYGRFWLDAGRSIGAHRYAYETLVGPIARDLTLDHLCRNKPCVNPDHLEPVTLRENLRRMKTVLKSCSNGHPYTPATTYLYHGQRICRICLRARRRVMKAKRRIRARLVA